MKQKLSFNVCSEAGEIEEEKGKNLGGGGRGVG